MKYFNQITLILYVVIPFLCAGTLLAQVEEYEIHDRGMLWETMYNDGIISRGWSKDNAETAVPLCEWPPRSATYINQVLYYGQHNQLGGGIILAVSEEGNQTGPKCRRYALMGAVGDHEPERVIGVWSFPQYIKKINNFPLIEDPEDPNWGELNPEYDPNEAEQIITARWSSSVGVTVTRTSRVWSYPDYDDMVIMEYELENTGDLDGNPVTQEQNVNLRDVYVAIQFGFAPSMMGYARYHGNWKYDGGHRKGDAWSYYDYDYWLFYTLNERTFTNDSTLWGKPEPDPEKFKEYAESGKNFGGLYSPQAPGSVMLYYDSEHLAYIDPYDMSDINEPGAVNESETAFGSYQAEIGGYGYEIGDYIRIDKNGHLKQPWVVYNIDGTQYSDRKMGGSRTYYDPYNNANNAKPDHCFKEFEEDGTYPNNDPDRWIGRGRRLSDAYKPSFQTTSFGPYNLNVGDKIEFSVAEVVGYGATPGRLIHGGPRKKTWELSPDWDNRPIVIDGQLMTEHYISDYGYPDFVNSDVVTVDQVAHKAFHAYLGQDPQVPVWPEDNPSDGVYQIPVPPPAPPIKVKNTADGNISVNWKRDVEDFTHERLTGAPVKYIVSSSEVGWGLWQENAVIPIGESLNEEGLYEIILDLPTFHVGEKRFFCVVSEDANGHQSGRTNVIELEKNIGSVQKLGNVYVVPNPFKVVSGFTGGGEVSDQIGFYGLPEKCTIRVFSFSGQLVQTIEHDKPLYSVAYLQLTRNNQKIASGVYYYVVTTPEGKQTDGKFIVIK